MITDMTGKIFSLRSKERRMGPSSHLFVDKMTGRLWNFSAVSPFGLEMLSGKVSPAKLFNENLILSRDLSWDCSSDSQIVHRFFYGDYFFVVRQMETSPRYVKLSKYNKETKVLDSELEIRHTQAVRHFYHSQCDVIGGQFIIAGGSTWRHNGSFTGVLLHRRIDLGSMSISRTQDFIDPTAGSYGRNTYISGLAVDCQNSDKYYYTSWRTTVGGVPKYFYWKHDAITLNKISEQELTGLGYHPIGVMRCDENYLYAKEYPSGDLMKWSKDLSSHTSIATTPTFEEMLMTTDYLFYGRLNMLSSGVSRYKKSDDSLISTGGFCLDAFTLFNGEPYFSWD